MNAIILLILLLIGYLLYNRLLHYVQIVNNTPDRRFPDYETQSPDNQLQLFIDEKCVGEGSCIYNPLDEIASDGVLFDWQRHLRKYGQTMFKSPPLDPIQSHLLHLDY